MGLMTLGGLLNEMCRYEEAEEILLEACMIIESGVGKETLSYIDAINNLGICYTYSNRLKKAEACYREGIALFEKLEAANTSIYSFLHYNLAVVYSKYGLNEKAIEIIYKTLEIEEKEYGKMHPNYAESLTSLAGCYRALNRKEKETIFLKEALEIYKKLDLTKTPSYSNVVINFAMLLHKNNEYQKAEERFKEGCSILKTVRGKIHPEYASAILNRGLLYLDMERYTQAEQFFLEAKDILIKTIGKNNDYYNKSLIALGELYFRTNQIQKGLDVFQESNYVFRSIASQSKTHLSAIEVQFFMNDYISTMGRFYSLNHYHVKEWLAQDAYDNALYYKGNILESSLKLEQVIRLSSDSIKNLHHQWRGYQRRIATAYSESEPDSMKLKDLEEKANQLEKELITSSTLFEALQKQVTWDNIQANLKPKEAAIEFIHYDFYNIEKTDSTFYSALILLPNATAPIFISLGEEQKLENLILKNQKTQQQHINGLYAKSAVKDNLYNFIWKPIEKELKGIETIYYSPSGLLHRLNLGAISIDEKEIMNERYDVVQLNSTRQLAAPPTIAATENSAHLFGGITYNLNTDEETTPSSSADIFNKNSRSINFHDNYSELRGDAWSPLKWTDIEVQTIDLMLQDNGISTTLHTESNATEEAFYKIGTAENSPRILHLATHGYFFPDPKEEATNNPLGMEQEPVFKTSDHPMIRSGLILAGANQAWEGKKVPEGREDGILTAYEISQMNLSNTELVVLSACETGLGDIEGNEGVYGLQRAFKIAGAKYLIMSLWQVPDFQTQELMTAFYTEWLENKKTIPNAFRTAQQQMRAKFPEPFNWAGFVLVE